MDVKKVIQQFLAGEVLAKGGGKVDLEAGKSLFENGVLDSLSVVPLVTFLEEQFSVVIEDEEMLPENFLSVTAIARLIEQKLAQGGGAE